MTSLDKASLAGSPTLWRAVGSGLLFLDAVGGMMLLPVLPMLTRELGVESDYVMAAWTGLVVGIYYTGRSGSLAAARFCPSAIANASLLYTSVVLGLSAVTYAISGQLVGPLGLRWLALFRFFSGILDAAHRILGLRSLKLAAASTMNQNDMTVVENNCDRIPASRGAVVAGRVIGCTVAGFLFAQGDARPIARLCLVWMVAHFPPSLFLLLIWRRSGSCGNSRRWSTVASTDFGRASLGSRVKGGRAEGSEIELGLSNVGKYRPDHEDGTNGGGQVTARSTSPVVAPASLRGGAPRTVESDHVEVPQRYLRGCQGDPVEAQRRWRLTLEWRAQERVDEILQEPQPYFNIIKRHYPHYIHRRARNGCPVWIEVPTRINLPALRSSGVSDEALRRHYVFVTEYLWGVVEPEFDTGQAVTILDVKGLRMRDLAGEALAFVKQATSIVQDHYVERSNRMFIVNAPSYFSMIWRIIRPMLNERTQAKIAIIGADEAKVAAALLEVIDAENLPRQYGGSCEVELGDSQEERELRAYVARITSSLAAEGEDEAEAEAEVDLRPHGVTGSASLEEPQGDVDGTGADDDDSVFHKSESRNGVAGHALSRVAGALGWARSKLQWRRSQIAHLGDENAFVYDEAQQRWVLGGEVDKAGNRHRNGTGASSSPASGGEAKGTTRKDRRASSGRLGGDSAGSDTSEEMTVLAIQAAHFSLNRGGTKFSPVPSNTSPVPNRTRRDSDRPLEKTRHPALFGNGSFADPMADQSDACERAGNEVVLSCPCLRPLGRRSAFPAFGGVLYVVSLAVREAVPVWALSGIQAGGFGAAPQDLGVAIATGVVVLEAGRALTSVGCLGLDFLGHRDVMLCAVRGRIVVVVILGMLYLVARLAPGRIPSAVMWVALTGTFTAIQLALGVARDERQRSLNHISSNGVASNGAVGNDTARPIWSMPWSSLLGDVFGSAIGPLFLALGLCTGLPSPIDASLWFVCCVCVDLLLLVQARDAGELHTQLVDVDEANLTPERVDDAPPGARFTGLV